MRKNGEEKGDSENVFYFARLFQLPFGENVMCSALCPFMVMMYRD